MDVLVDEQPGDQRAVPVTLGLPRRLPVLEKLLGLGEPIVALVVELFQLLVFSLEALDLILQLSNLAASGVKPGVELGHLALELADNRKVIGVRDGGVVKLGPKRGAPTRVERRVQQLLLGDRVL